MRRGSVTLYMLNDLCMYKEHHNCKKQNCNTQSSEVVRHSSYLRNPLPSSVNVNADGVTMREGSVDSVTLTSRSGSNVKFVN